MNHDFLLSLHKVTPITDKLLAVAGAGVAAMLTLGNVQTIVGITVGVLTAVAIIPRIVIGWIDMRRKLRREEEEVESGEE